MKRKKFEFRCTDYEYVTEGGRSILLQPSPSPSSFYFWKTVPIVKKIPKLSFSAPQYTSGHSNFMDTWFHGKFILRPLHYVRLKRKQFNQLYQNIDSLRPKRRKKIISQDCCHYPLYGSIERNIIRCNEEISLSFEFKIKC